MKMRGYREDGSILWESEVAGIVPYEPAPWYEGDEQFYKVVFVGTHKVVITTKSSLDKYHPGWQEFLDEDGVDKWEER